MGRAELVGQTGNGVLDNGQDDGQGDGLANHKGPMQKMGLPVDTVAKMQLRNLPPYVAVSTLRNGGWSDTRIAGFLRQYMGSPTNEKVQAALAYTG